MAEISSSTDRTAHVTQAMIATPPPRLETCLHQIRPPSRRRRFDSTRYEVVTSVRGGYLVPGRSRITGCRVAPCRPTVGRGRASAPTPLELTAVPPISSVPASFSTKFHPQHRREMGNSRRAVSRPAPRRRCSPEELPPPAPARFLDVCGGPLASDRHGRLLSTYRATHTHKERGKRRTLSKDLSPSTIPARNSGGRLRRP